MEPDPQDEVAQHDVRRPLLAFGRGPEEQGLEPRPADRPLHRLAQLTDAASVAAEERGVVHQDEILLLVVRLALQGLLAGDARQLDGHAVDVAPAVVVLRPVGEADPGGVGPGLAEDADPQVLGDVLDLELGLDAAVVLGVLPARTGRRDVSRSSRLIRVIAAISSASPLGITSSGWGAAGVVMGGGSSRSIRAVSQRLDVLDDRPCAPPRRAPSR